MTTYDYILAKLVDQAYVLFQHLEDSNNEELRKVVLDLVNNHDFPIDFLPDGLYDFIIKSLEQQKKENI